MCIAARIKILCIEMHTFSHNYISKVVLLNCINLCAFRQTWDSGFRIAIPLLLQRFQGIKAEISTMMKAIVMREQNSPLLNWIGLKTILTTMLFCKYNA